MSYPPEDRRDHPELYRVPTEEDVPNSDRPLPSSRNTVLAICGVVALLAIVAVTVMLALDAEVVGLALAILGVLLGALAIYMAAGDARVTTTAPVVATICAALIAIVIGLDFGEADDALEGDGPARLVGVDDDQIPQDPAAIADVDNDAQPAAATEDPDPVGDPN